MKRTLLLLCAVPLLASFALASNPEDEQTVRTAYAKLAYAVQSKIVYAEAQKNQNLKASELTQKLQENELRFDIIDMSSGALSEIASKPYSDFVTQPHGQDVLSIMHNTATFDEKGQRFTSLFAVPYWVHGPQSQADWSVPVKDALAGEQPTFSRYVTATIVVHFQGRTRTYRTLWWFGTDIRAIDLVTGNSILRSFVTESAYPSVLTDTSLRSRSVVNDWLASTQRFDASCKTGKQDVCCDSEMRCGVHSEDLRSTKPAPNTTAEPKKEGL
jgi:hypothetical protein